MTDKHNGSVYIDVDDMDWEPTQFPGVAIKVLWKDEASDAYTALFQLEPGAELPRHRHCGVEQTFVLQGSLVDEHGVCSAGNFVWRHAGSDHTAHSPDGCLAIGIFQKSGQRTREATVVCAAKPLTCGYPETGVLVRQP